MASFLPKEKIARSYCSLLISGIIFGCILIYAHRMDSFQNQFFERDPALSYYQTSGDEVTTSMLYEITLSISFSLLIIVAIFSRKAPLFKYYFLKHRTNHEEVVQRLNFLLLFFMGLCCAIFSGESANTIIKNVVGRPRPAAFYMCNYKGYADAVLSGDYSTYDSLTTTNAEGHVSNCYGAYSDAWASFPSGHASMSGITMTYCTLLLRNFLEVEDNNYLGFKNMVAFSPMVLAAWICVTRLIDRKHHPDDVMAGFIIGTIAAILAYWTVHEMMLRCINYTVDEDDLIIDKIRNSNPSNFDSSNVLHNQNKL